MTFDYADWDDEHYGEGETAVTLTLEGTRGDGDFETVTFVTKALGGDVKLSFTLAPEDTLDLLHRFIRFARVGTDDVKRIMLDVVKERLDDGDLEEDREDPDPDAVRDALVDARLGLT